MKGEGWSVCVCVCGRRMKSKGWGVVVATFQAFFVLGGV